MSGIRPPLRIVALAVCSLFVLSGCASGSTEGTHSGYADREGPTVIGTDGSAESRVVAALYGELLTAAGEEVKTAGAPYASAIDTAQAVVDGKISIAPAYESTLLRAMPGAQTMPGNMEATLSMALPPGIVALRRRPPRSAGSSSRSPGQPPSATSCTASPTSPRPAAT